MTVIPNPPYDKGPLLAALCVWREARSESPTAKLGVVWVLRNRNAMAPAQGFRHTMDEEILRPWQFSSFNEGDPNSHLYPIGESPTWTECKQAVASDEPDPTGGAQFYFSLPLKEPPAAWGPVEISTVIGALTFCRIVEPLVS